MTDRNDAFPQSETESAAHPPVDAYPVSQPVDPRRDKPPSTAAAVSAICGIVACVFNLFVITSLLGAVFGIIALAFGLIALISSRQGQSGLVLTGISFFILLVWISSVVVPLLLDPTLTLDGLKLG